MKVIDTREAVRVFNRQAVVLAAMDSDHYVEGHIPGSFLAPTDPQDLVRSTARLIDGRTDIKIRGPRTHVPLLIYGTNARSSRPFNAAAALERAGYRAVYVYADGMTGWRAEALATSKQLDSFVSTYAHSASLWEREWEAEHPYEMGVTPF